ncbi:hypothetical protein ACFO0S_14510 [Chryseomicrobium palamuruense]|uniref:Lipoprotein n=1 Tax=Chryseomicrobium palamuruense TaxID=682973 RepID=A0ABV8UY38_9BACL
MKKWWLLNIILMVLMLSGCMSSQANDNRPDVSKLEPQSLSEMIQDAGLENVDALEVQSGSTGEKKDTTDPILINEFMKQIASVTYTPDPNQEERIGWVYRVTANDGDKSFEFYPNYVENVYYLADGDVKEMMEALFQEIEKQEPVGAGWYPTQSPPTLELQVGSETVRMGLGSYQWNYIEKGTGEVLSIAAEAAMAPIEQVLALSNPPKVNMNQMTNIIFVYKPQTYTLTLWTDDDAMVPITSLQDLKGIGPAVIQVSAEWEQGKAMYYGVMDIQ